jgi:hypothetical protein
MANRKQKRIEILKKIKVKIATKPVEKRVM